MKKIYLLQYNNYYNKQIKGANQTVASLLAAAEANTTLAKVVNFNYGDGITTTQIVNHDIIANPRDYLLVLDDSAETSATPESRWFILKSVKIREGQFQLHLKRDVITDNYDEVITSPVFIEKATLPATDPLIFNDEGLSYNEIKTDEILLSDRTGCPWLVGYLDPKTESQSIPWDYTKTKNAILQSAYSLATWQYKDYIVTDPTATPNIKVRSTSSNAIVDTLFKAWAGIILGAASYAIDLNNPDWLGFQKTPLDSYIRGSLQSTKRVDSRITWQTWYGDTAYHNELLAAMNEPGSTLMAEYNALFNVNETIITSLKNYNGKKIQFKNGDVYTCKIISQADNIIDQHINITTPLAIHMKNIATDSAVFNNQYDNDSFSVYYSGHYYYLALTQEEGDTTTEFTLPAELDRNSTDREYHIFCAPLGRVRMTLSDGSYFYTSEAITQAAINGMVKKLGYASSGGTGHIYDLQILPYCPVPQYITSNARLSFNTLDPAVAAKTYTVVDDGNNNNVGIIIYASNVDVTFDIKQKLYLDGSQRKIVSNESTVCNYSDTVTLANASVATVNLIVSYQLPTWATAITAMQTSVLGGTISNVFGGLTITKYNYEPDTQTLVVYYTLSKQTSSPLTYFTITIAQTINAEKTSWSEEPNYTAIDYKIANQCNKWRLCSPNYSGTFEFNVAKNFGITGFNVDMTLKPTNPYIHVNPIFGGLYGQDFDDSRGLICGGDFSWGASNDAWTQYQIANKNYANIFDRDIQNMDITHKVARDQLALNNANSIINQVQSSVKSMITKPDILTVANAGIDMAQTAVNAGLSAKWQQELQEEQRDYSIDKYNYSLQNIQALPSSLAKVNSLTKNNKIFPFIEFYTCTNDEKEALRSKLIYDGMTVMKIGNIITYLDSSEQRYIKCKAIQLGVNGDSALLNEIKNELDRGQYWKAGV